MNEVGAGPRRTAQKERNEQGEKYNKSSRRGISTKRVVRCVRKRGLALGRSQCDDRVSGKDACTVGRYNKRDHGRGWCSSMGGRVSD